MHRRPTYDTQLQERPGRRPSAVCVDVYVIDCASAAIMAAGRGSGSQQSLCCVCYYIFACFCISGSPIVQ